MGLYASCYECRQTWVLPRSFSINTVVLFKVPKRQVSGPTSLSSSVCDLDDNGRLQGYVDIFMLAGTLSKIRVEDIVNFKAEILATHAYCVSGPRRSRLSAMFPHAREGGPCCYKERPQGASGHAPCAALLGAMSGVSHHERQSTHGGVIPRLFIIPLKTHAPPESCRAW